MTLAKTQLWITGWILLASGILGTNGRNPVAVSGLEASFYVIAIGYAIYYFTKEPLRRLDVLVLLLPIVAVGLSSTLAYMNFHQPIPWGLAESRRCFGLYVYFPVVRLVRKGSGERTRYLSVLDAIITISVVASALGLAWKYFGLQWNSAFEEDAASMMLRGNRVIVGGLFSGLGVLACAVRVRYEGLTWRYALAFLVITFELVIVEQTMQVIGAVLTGLLVVSIYQSEISTKMKAAVVLTVVLVTVTLVLVAAGKAGVYGQLIAQRTSVNVISAGSRAIAIRFGFGELPRYWWGTGGLAYKWHGGFTTIWDPHFWLADIGVFGTLFRFGIFSAILIPLMAYLIVRRPRCEYRELRTFCWCCAAALLLVAPLQGWLEYRASLIGILLALKLPSVRRTHARLITADGRWATVRGTSRLSLRRAERV